MKTQRFYLKKIKQEDIHYIHQGLSDPKVTQYYGVHFDTLEATQEQMDWYANLEAQKTGLWWAIYDQATDAFCGAGGFNDADVVHKKAEIGFWLLPAYWGQGILKEVMPLLFDLGFNTLGLNRIEGFVQANNQKCKAALEKINFKHEGCMRACEWKDGAFIDVDIYAILKND